MGTFGHGLPKKITQCPKARVLFKCTPIADGSFQVLVFISFDSFIIVLLIETIFLLWLSTKQIETIYGFPKQNTWVFISFDFNSVLTRQTF